MANATLRYQPWQLFVSFNGQTGYQSFLAVSIQRPQDSQLVLFTSWGSTKASAVSVSGCSSWGYGMRL
jgi:hypothetical protein